MCQSLDNSQNIASCEIQNLIAGGFLKYPKIYCKKKQKMPFYFLLIFNFLWINKVSLFPYFSQKIQSSWKHSKVYPLHVLVRLNICQILSFLATESFTKWTSLSHDFEFNKPFQYFPLLGMVSLKWFLLKTLIKAPFFDKVLFEGFFFLKGKNTEIMVNALKFLMVRKIFFFCFHLCVL